MADAFFGRAIGARRVDAANAGIPCRVEHPFGCVLVEVGGVEAIPHPQLHGSENNLGEGRGGVIQGGVCRLIFAEFTARAGW